MILKVVPHDIKVDYVRVREQLIVCRVIFVVMMMMIFIIYLFSIFHVTTSVDYTCDRQSTCGCSKRSTVAITKIIGGEPVYVPHSWGWIASLRRDNIHNCGASLLTPWFVITAAHCVNDITSLSRLSLNFGITYLTTIGQLRNVTKMHIHPQYNQRLLTNDLAILRLDKAISLTQSNISTICLPDPREFHLKATEYPPTGDNLVAIGWGVTEPFAVLPSTVLRQVTLQAMSSTDGACTNTIYNDTVQFCAGFPDGGKDTCKGDSGGPLMLFSHGRWQLAGLTSYGGICGSPGFAGVYTRISYYDSYIQEIINSNDTYIIQTKQIDEIINLNSNTKSFYEKSKIEFLLIFIYIVYRTLLFSN